MATPTIPLAKPHANGATEGMLQQLTVQTRVDDAGKKVRSALVRLVAVTNAAGVYSIPTTMPPTPVTPSPLPPNYHPPGPPVAQPDMGQVLIADVDNLPPAMAPLAPAVTAALDAVEAALAQLNAAMAAAGQPLV